MGQDGHDRGAKVIATALADIGFDVDIGPLFQLQAEVARSRLRAMCTSSAYLTLAAGHKTLVPELIDELKAGPRMTSPLWLEASFPTQDYELLYHAGVVAVFRSGHGIPQCAQQVLAIMLGKVPAAVAPVIVRVTIVIDVLLCSDDGADRRSVKWLRRANVCATDRSGRAAKRPRESLRGATS